jgi:hypothetical protein
MVDVAVGQDDQIEVANTEGSECREHRVGTLAYVSRSRRPRVHEHRCALTLHERGVALADVEEDRAGGMRLLWRDGPKRQERRDHNCAQALPRGGTGPDHG